MANREPVVIAAVVAAVWVILLRRERVPQHTSNLTGQLNNLKSSSIIMLLTSEQLLGWKRNPSVYFWTCSKEKEV